MPLLHVYSGAARLVIVSLSLTIIACGGGGSSSGDTGNTPDPVDNTLNAEPNEKFSAGAATGHRITAGAFSDPSGNIRIRKQTDFRTGNSFFEKPWVTAPASTRVRDGLGPLFNVHACQSCHIKDGRGHAPEHGGTNFASLLIRTARTNISDTHKKQMRAGTLQAVGDSTVGLQIQDKSVAGVLHEADLKVTYTPKVVTFADGFKVTLRKPNWEIKGNYGKFDKDTIFSVRTAPPAIGQGMLEAIKVADLQALADPNDANKDGISGRINRVKDELTNKPAVGRFGWKAGVPSVLQQTAAAFHGDMGLTSRMFTKENCLPHQKDCLAQPNGNGDNTAEYGYEVSDDLLDFVTFYVRNLAVPIRRDHEAQNVLRGKQLFNDIGCASCHAPKFVTAKSSIHVEQSEQTIRPYTDLLLHDMGEDLADFDINNNPKNNELVEFSATAREWRTAPLWGIGLTHVVDHQATFLHDGRARTIMEAVLWHGGEAEAAKQKVLQLNAAQRADLMAFLESL